MAERFEVISIPPVTLDDAMTLMVHHITLAGAYYLAMESDDQSDRHEIIDSVTVRLRIADDPVKLAGEAWITTITEGYEGEEDEA